MEISDEARPILTEACKHFDTPEAAVVKARIEGDEFVMLWDRGSNGIAKDRVLLDDLQAAEEDSQVDERDETQEPLEVTVDATDGALRLMEKYHIDAADVLDLVGDKRLTARDVRTYMKEND